MEPKTNDEKKSIFVPPQYQGIALNAYIDGYKKALIDKNKEATEAYDLGRKDGLSEEYKDGYFHGHLAGQKQKEEAVAEARREVLADIQKKYWLNPKRSKSEIAKENAWNDLGNTLRNGV